jgi:tetratricopeptide (TPR) repeat protein
MAYDEAIKRLRKTTTGDVRGEFFMSQAELGALQTRSQFVLAKEHPEKAELDSLVRRFEAYADSKRQPDLVLLALSRAGEIAFHYSFDLEGAKRIYNKVVVRSSGTSERTREALFSLEEIALAQGKLDTARTELAAISDILAKRNRKEDEESRKRVLFELARIDYYSGDFDTALSKLAIVSADPASDYANDAIGLRSHIEENREAGNESALKLFARAELEVLGRNYPTALSAYQSIRDASPNAPVADDATLRTADLLVQLGNPVDAVHVLEEMQDKMSTSPLADRAGFRAAEIVEKEIKDKPRAQKMYEDFLERYEKSPLCTEARKRARKLRGDSF